MWINRMHVNVDLNSDFVTIQIFSFEVAKSLKGKVWQLILSNNQKSNENTDLSVSFFKETAEPTIFDTLATKT